MLQMNASIVFSDDAPETVIVETWRKQFSTGKAIKFADAKRTQTNEICDWIEGDNILVAL